MVKFSRTGVGIPPVNEKDDILIDSMIINHILFALGEEYDKEEYDKNNPHNPYKYNLKKSKDIFQKIEKRLLECGSKLILLDRVEYETINMKKHFYKKTYTEEDIEVALSKIGRYERITVSKEMLKDVERLYRAKKYVKLLTNEPLSRTDCLLLKVHVTQGLMDITRPVSLLTEDETLINACKTEGRKTYDIDGYGESYIQRREQDRKNREAEYKKNEQERIKKEQEILLEKSMCVCYGCGRRQTRKKECRSCATPLKNLRKKIKN